VVSWTTSARIIVMVMVIAFIINVNVLGIEEGNSVKLYALQLLMEEFV